MAVAPTALFEVFSELGNFRERFWPCHHRKGLMMKEPLSDHLNVTPRRSAPHACDPSPRREFGVEAVRAWRWCGRRGGMGVEAWRCGSSGALAESVESARQNSPNTSARSPCSHCEPLPPFAPPPPGGSPQRASVSHATRRKRRVAHRLWRIPSPYAAPRLPGPPPLKPPRWPLRPRKTRYVVLPRKKQKAHTHGARITPR